MRRVVFINNCDDAFGQELANMFLSMDWFVVAGLSQLDERKHFIIRDNLRFADSILIVEADPEKPEAMEKVKSLILAHVDGLDCLIHIAAPFSSKEINFGNENFDKYHAYMTQSFTNHVSDILSPLVKGSNGSIIHISFGAICAFPLHRHIEQAASFGLRKSLMSQTLKHIKSGLRSTFIQSSSARWSLFSADSKSTNTLAQILQPKSLFAYLRKTFLLNNIKRLATRRIDKSYLTATNSFLLAIMFSSYLVDSLFFRFHFYKIKFQAIKAATAKK